jgi:N-acetylmuramoyl-L-alanine amidase
MSLNLRLALQKSLALTFVISFSGAFGLGALAQALSTYNHIVSIVEDKGGRFVVIGTSKMRIVGQPFVQYFPGEDGQTIMVADFAGLVCDRPATAFVPPVYGVKEVHLSQLESSPPVFRIAITTSQPHILKKLEFQARPGSLIIKWPCSPPPVAQPQLKPRITYAPYAPQVSAFEPAVVPELRPAYPDDSNGNKGLPYAQEAIKQTPSNSSLVEDSRTDKYAYQTQVAKPVDDLASRKRSIVSDDQSHAQPKVAPDYLTASEGASSSWAETNRLLQSKKEKSDAKLSTAHAEKAALQTSTGKKPIASEQRLSKQAVSGKTDGHGSSVLPVTASVSKVQSETNSKKAIENNGKLSASNSFNKNVFSQPTSAPLGQVKAIDKDDRSSSSGVSQVPSVVPDFHLPKLGPIADRTLSGPANLLPASPSSASPLTANLSPALPQVAMLAASQITGNGQVQSNSPAVSQAESLLDKVKRTASFIESTSQSSVQKLLPQIKNDANLLVGGAPLTQAKPLPTIAVAGFCPLKILLNGNDALSYNAFRLHEPERYVIDVQGLPELSTVAKPELPVNGFVNDLSFDKGEQNSNRLIVDLSAADIPVQVIESDDKRSLSLLVGQGVNLFSRLKSPENSLVVLDAGHGGSDPGAERGDIAEKEITLDIVERLKNDLQSKGLKVILTRANDTFVSLEDRVKITNSASPNCFVSVHVNSMETTTTIHGIETYYQTEQSKALADVIHDSLVDNLEAPNRNVRKARFYVVNHTSVPAILAEVGFISNKEERERLISSDYQAKVAEALADGVILYLNKRHAAASISGNALKQAATDGRALANHPGILAK